MKSTQVRSLRAAAVISIVIKMLCLFGLFPDCVCVIQTDESVRQMKVIWRRQSDCDRGQRFVNLCFSHPCRQTKTDQSLN